MAEEILTAQDSEEEALSEQMRIRREKLKELQDNGKNPYAITRFDVTSDSVTVKEELPKLEQANPDGIGESYEVSIAGRIMSRRIMGKASFCDILDGKGRIQAYVRREDVGEDVYADFKKWDIGDIVGIKGFAFRTRMGEISVHAKEITLLSKSLRSLPEKFHGLLRLLLL